MKVFKTDLQIQQDVLHELAWDGRVAPTEVGIAVDNSVVTLTGTVSSWAKRAAAEEAAHRVSGVLDVANDLAVRLPDGVARTDSELAAAVRQQMVWDVFVPEERIQTTVSDGVVILRGTVEHAWERDDAVRVIGRLAGVRAIENHIRISHGEVSPSELRTAIHAALERRAAREANRIEVSVDQGRVTLTGTVQSWSERVAAVGAARGTRGVAQVVDHLRIS